MLPSRYSLSCCSWEVLFIYATIIFSIPLIYQLCGLVSIANWASARALPCYNTQLLHRLDTYKYDQLEPRMTILLLSLTGTQIHLRTGEGNVFLQPLFCSPHSTQECRINVRMPWLSKLAQMNQMINIKNVHYSGHSLSLGRINDFLPLPRLCDSQCLLPKVYFQRS